MVEKSSAERGNRTLSEELAVLKSDKESLETGLYEQQQIGQQLEGKKTSLEQDIQVILVIIRQSVIFCPYDNFQIYHINISRPLCYEMKRYRPRSLVPEKSSRAK